MAQNFTTTQYTDFNKNISGPYNSPDTSFKYDKLIKYEDIDYFVENEL